MMRDQTEAAIVDRLREGMGGLRSHAVIPDTTNEPEWYLGQAGLMQDALTEILALRAKLYDVICGESRYAADFDVTLDHESGAALLVPAENGS